VKSKTAIVTGAAGSLGSELALMAVNAGWNVVMLDSNKAGLEQAYDRIAEGGPGVAALYPMDLAGSNPELFEALLDTVENEFAGLDAIVHCAARFEGLAPVEHVLPQEWLMQMQVNLNAAWLLSAMAMPLLRMSPAGKLVFLLEDMDKVEGPLWGAYGVSKHALRALVNQLAEECKAGTIEVKGVNPGPMRSKIRAAVYHSENPAKTPSPEPIASRITAYLDGNEAWGDVFIDLREALKC
jgi:NAD(P)-dependent dehydrogenase (short-subunit alcohol dehydrogenase family)